MPTQQSAIRLFRLAGIDVFLHWFDTFGAQRRCPSCSAPCDAARCVDCGSLHEVDAWARRPPLRAKGPSPVP